VHFIELGIWKTKVTGGNHPIMTGFYAATDFSVNLDRLVVAPKVGVFASLMVVGVGAELCYYTDFKEGSLRLIPSIGIFTPYFKLTANPHIILSNKKFIDRGHLNITVRIHKLKRSETH
jgi:hypothetical protein